MVIFSMFLAFMVLAAIVFTVIAGIAALILGLCFLKKFRKAGTVLIIVGSICAAAGILLMLLEMI